MERHPNQKIVNGFRYLCLAAVPSGIVKVALAQTVLHDSFRFLQNTIFHDPLLRDGYVDLAFGLAGFAVAEAIIIEKKLSERRERRKNLPPKLV